MWAVIGSIVAVALVLGGIGWVADAIDKKIG